MTRRAIVFGSDGLIGGAALRRWRAAGWDVAGASRRGGAAIRFDLVDGSTVDAFVGRAPGGVALLAAGISRIDACRERGAAARAVNVEGTCRLIESSWAAGWLPVFLSTDHVFDGERGGYRETDPTGPLNAYGEMKREVERFLDGSGRPYLNIRLGKVFSMDREGDTLLADWHRTLRGGGVVRCVEGQRVNPTCVEDVVDGIAALVERGAHGTFHVCAREALTREEIAREFARRCGFPIARVIVEPEASFGFLDRRPRDPTMDPAAFIEATGRRPRAAAAWFEEASRW